MSNQEQAAERSGHEPTFDELKCELGGRVGGLIAAQGDSQKQAAAKLHTDYTTLNNAIHGRHGPGAWWPTFVETYRPDAETIALYDQLQNMKRARSRRASVGAHDSRNQRQSHGLSGNWCYVWVVGEFSDDWTARALAGVGTAAASQGTRTRLQLESTSPPDCVWSATLECFQGYLGGLFKPTRSQRPTAPGTLLLCAWPSIEDPQLLSGRWQGSTPRAEDIGGNTAFARDPIVLQDTVGDGWLDLPGARALVPRVPSSTALMLPALTGEGPANEEGEGSSP